ncbi:hypothetical protein FACS1894217_13750 [Clostridia bacterium]|nr:hypothetical protein FACS1894217_13750 [Clostridia bacterium]
MGIALIGSIIINVISIRILFKALRRWHSDRIEITMLREMNVRSASMNVKNNQDKRIV